MTERNDTAQYDRKFNNELQRRMDLPVEEGSAQAAAGSGARMIASAAVVNRTHRIVRERARNLQAQRKRARSLWLPLAVFSGLLIILCTAVWSVLDEYELIPTGIPDASQQMFVLLMWCLPLSALVLAFVLLRRGTAADNPENGNAQ